MPKEPTKLEWFLQALQSHNSDECLVWPWAKYSYGHGMVHIGKEKVCVHRLAFKITRGHWPAPKCLHECDNPPCFNPRHLTEGTQLQNLRDCHKRGRGACGPMKFRSKRRHDHRSDRQTKFAWLLQAIHSHNSDECLLWPFSTKGPGYKKGEGYGQVLFEGKNVGVHRVAFRITHGRWPAGDACHTCDVRACFNPRHIIDGSHFENMADATRKGRMHPGELTGNSKLTAEDVRSIRKEFVRYNKRFGGQALSIKYGVSFSLISLIMKRKIWRHLD